MPEKPHNFWQELKRRKVIRVIIGYLASAYVLLELTSIIAEPFGLPQGSIKLVFVLLCVGFIIAIYLSWIYDFTSEGIKKTEPSKTAKPKESSVKPSKWKLRVSNAIIGVLFVAVLALAYPRIFKKDDFKNIRDEDGKISIAVMPFSNTTNDTLMDVWKDGIQNIIITNLSNSEDLSVRHYQTMFDILQSNNYTNYSSITPNFARDISQKLNTNTYILGNILSTENIIRINAQLVESATNKIYKTFQLDGENENDIIIIADSLSKLIQTYLQIKLIEQNTNYETRTWIQTGSPEAYRSYLRGMDKFWEGDYKSAIEYLTNVSRIDSNFQGHQLFLEVAYSNNGQYEKSREINNKLFEQIDDLSYFDQLTVKIWRANLDKNPRECVRYLEEAIELDPKQRSIYYQLGLEYQRLWQYEKAINAFETALAIDRAWGGNWKWIPVYTNLSRSYNKVGNFIKQKEVIELGLSIIPEDPRLILQLAICEFSLGDTINANKYFKEYESMRKESYGWSDAAIMNSIGDIYYQSNCFDKAEYYYLIALELDPERANSKANLALLYFENDTSLNEGMELINRALDINPDSYSSIYTKGLGLYKEGFYEEALSLLERSWNLRRFYNHKHYLLIQEVEKALTNQ